MPSILRHGVENHVAHLSSQFNQFRHRELAQVGRATDRVQQGHRRKPPNPSPRRGVPFSLIVRWTSSARHPCLAAARGVLLRKRRNPGTVTPPSAQCASKSIVHIPRPLRKFRSGTWPETLTRTPKQIILQ